MTPPQPYFGRVGASPRGRLLVVSWHFPPSQAAGALRWQKFSRYAVEWGFGVDVIAVSPGSLKEPDTTRLDELPDGVRAFGLPPAQPPLDRLVHGAATARNRLGSRAEATARNRTSARSDASNPRPTSFRRQDVRFRPTRAGSWLRAFRAWREHAVEGAWAREAARLGARLHEEQPVRAVITCGPPHMVHEAGRRLQHGQGIPFLMDMRDPWSLQQRLIAHVASPVWLWLARRLEARAVTRATLVTCNTEPFRRAMQAAYPEKAEDIITVMNGYDEEPLPPAPPQGPFVLAYAGSIYLDRDPRPLFRAVHRVVTELKLGPDDLRVEFVGNVNDYGGVPLDDMAQEEEIAQFVRTGPLLPRHEALRFMARATMLVNLPQDSDLAIPSKVFEYLRFPAWILAMTRQESATAQALRDTHADVVDPEDVESMAGAIRRRYEEYVDHGRPSPAVEGGGAALSRRRQAERLFEELLRRLGDQRP